MHPGGVRTAIRLIFFNCRVSFEKHLTLEHCVLVYTMLPNFGFYMYVLLKACCIIKLAHDDLKM